MKKLVAFTTAALLIGCATPQPATTDYDSKGRVVRTTVAMESEDYADLEIARHKANCQDKYYSAGSKISNGRDLALLTAIQALNPNDPCPTITTSKDADIAKAQERWSTVRTFLSKIPLLGGMAAGAYVGGKAVENRDPPEPIVVEQPEPIIVEQPEPIVIEPSSDSDD